MKQYILKQYWPGGEEGGGDSETGPRPPHGPKPPEPPTDSIASESDAAQ